MIYQLENIGIYKMSEQVRPFDVVKRKRRMLDTVERMDYNECHGIPRPERELCDSSTEIERMIYLEWEKDRYAL